MSRRLSRVLTLTAAAGLVALSVSAVHVPTYAAQPQSLNANDFHEVALQGFGDRGNSWAWSMAWFNNKLFVGSNRYYSCTSEGMLTTIPIIGMFIPYPPHDPNLQCPAGLLGQAKVKDLPGAISAEVWSMDPSINQGSPITQANWTMVHQDPYTATLVIGRHKNLQGPRDMGYRGMSVYQDVDGSTALYVSGVGTAALGGKNVPPPALYRTTDGVNFQPVPADPGTTMGDLNTLTTVPRFLGTGGACCMRGQETYVDSSGKRHFLILIGGVQGAGAMFISDDPRQGDNSFLQLTPSNMSVYEMASFNGHIYLGLQSTNGYSVVRTDCVTPAPPSPGPVGCAPTDFTQVVPPGGGLGSKGNQGITSMHVYTDPNGVPHLYVGTNGARSKQAAEIVRINTDDTWDLVMGDPRTYNGQLITPISGLTSGFGWQYNFHMWRMTDYQGVLYVGTYNYATHLLGSNQGDTLKPFMGFHLWASTDGVAFYPITQNGFGDIFNDGVRSLQGTPYGVFVGSTNDWYGLRIYQGQANTQAMQLAPQSVEIDDAATQANGAVTLTWNAPAAATLYHIYRAPVTHIHLNKTPKPDPTRLDMEVDPSHFPRDAWVPTTFSEVGTSNTPYFTDRTASTGSKYQYYVVSQDAAGNLSAQSTIASYPVVAPATTFGTLDTTLSNLGSSGRVPANQVAGYRQTLAQATNQAQAGNAQGAHATLETLRQQIAANAPAGGVNGRLYGEKLIWLIGRLERRLALSQAHLLSASQLR